jgi:hypothetical protein
MTRRTRNLAIALAGAVTLASGAYALGSQNGDGSAAATGTTATLAAGSAADHGPFGRGPVGPPPGRGLGLQALADKLGVDTAKLQAALDGIRAQQPRRDPRDEIATALADALGVSKARVTAALGKLHAKGPRPRHERFRDGMGPGAIANDIAKALGVDAGKVRSALKKLQASEQARHEAKRDELAAALAKRLGLPVSRVKAALGSFPPMPPPHMMGGGGPGPRPGVAPVPGRSATPDAGSAGTRSI